MMSVTVPVIAPVLGRVSVTVACVVLAAAVLGGCSKCGDFIFAQPNACHSGPPVR
jgi:hypothetical protein